MLRRDFLKAAAAFTAAVTSAKAALAAASPGCDATEKFVACRCGRDDQGADLCEVITFERTLISCLRDGSMVLIGVSGCAVGYEAFYRPAFTPLERPIEQHRHDSLMAMHARGMIVVEDVTVWNNYDAVSIRFAICTKEPTP